MAGMFRSVDVTRIDRRLREAAGDSAAEEEPLEIRLHGRPFAIIMRTPGADRELAAGFLLAERVLRSADDLGVIERCADPSRGHPQNVVNVRLVGRRADSLERLLGGRRRVATTSSCGLCGRLTIESLRTDLPPLAADWSLPAAVVTSMPDRLRRAQEGFDKTGGLHAAALFTAGGEVAGFAEDVGRHNAVDKVVGRLLMREELPASDRVLFVSGRSSFEIVQKAFFAGIPVVASVSAPSTMAIDLATEAGITLIGFVRGDRFNIYSHAQRVA